MRSTKVVYLRVLLLLLGLNLCTLNASSQYYSNDPTFFGGFIVGMNMAQIDGDNLAGYRCFGLNLGGIIHTALDEELTLSMEVIYSEKGSRAGGDEVPKVTNRGSFTINSHDIRIQSAEIPICLNYWVDEFMHVGGGLSYGRLVNAKEFLNGVEQQEDYPFNKNELSVVLNGNFKVVKGLFFNLRVQYSALNIRNIHNPNAGRAQQYSNVVALRLMYLFGK